MGDDDFIKSLEFQSFLYKVKHNEITLSLMPGEDPKKTKELVDNLLAYAPDSETMTLVEAKELVQRSGMIFVPSWDIERAFVLDQIRRQDKAISYEATSSDDLKRGSSYNIDTKTLAI